MTLPKITESTIRQYASAETFGRGQQYYRQGAVLSLVQRGDVLQAEVEGSEPAPYRVRLVFDAGGATEAACSCAYEWGGWCKHIVATLLAAINRPQEIEERPPLDVALADLDRAQLQALLLHLVEREPQLAEVIESQLALPHAAPTTRQTPPASRPRRTPVDPSALRRQVRAIVHGLDRLRPSQAYGQVGGVVDALDGVLDQVWAFVQADDGESALAMLEATTAEYLAHWEVLDDSDGDASSFFDTLGRAWTETLLCADLTTQERRAWAGKLARWQRDLEDYGVEESFGPALAAVRQGWDYPPLLRVLAGEITAQGAWEDEAPDWADELAIARLNVLERRGRWQDYLHLAEAEGQTERYVTMLVRLDRIQEAIAYGLEHLATAGEALALASALREHGEVEHGLKVAEHGLTLHGPKAPLATWLRDVAAALGETERALGAATIAFREELSLTAYLRVAELAGEDWPDRRAELLAVLRRSRSYYPQGPVDIFLHEGLIADAIAAVEPGATHALVEQVADAAIASHPDWVIAASRRQAESIMDGGKAQYYAAAARWLAKARAAYQVAAREGEWRAYLQELLERHGRKYKLVPLLEALR